MKWAKHIIFAGLYIGAIFAWSFFCAYLGETLNSKPCAAERDSIVKKQQAEIEQLKLELDAISIMYNHKTKINGNEKINR